MPASREDWGRTGPMLAARRVQISARYANRRVFADESGLNWRLLYDAERGRRATFKTETVRAFETAYRLEPGSLDGTLAGGPLRPLPAAAVPPVPRQPPGLAPLPAGAGRFMTEGEFRNLVLPSVAGPARLDCEEILALTGAAGPLLWPRRWEILSWRLFTFPGLEYADRRICEEILRLTDPEGRRLPWLATPEREGKWDYISAMRAIHARRNGRETGLTRPLPAPEPEHSLMRWKLHGTHMKSTENLAVSRCQRYLWKPKVADLPPLSDLTGGGIPGTASGWGAGFQWRRSLRARKRPRNS